MEYIATPNRIYNIFWDKSKLYNKYNTNVMYIILDIKERKKERRRERRSIIIKRNRVYDDSS